jgi:PKD repeat protein
VAFTGWTPNDAQLTQYSSYTFNASATDPNIGGAIAEFDWNFGDGTTKVVLANGKATNSYPYSYTTSGTYTLSVVAKNAAGLSSTPATRSITVAAAASPLAVSFSTPAAPVTVNPAIGGSVTVTFAVQVVNTGTGTISASGVVLNPGDAAATVGIPTDMGGGVWNIVVTYPAAATIGVRTDTPTIQVQDSNGISSTLVTGPAITVNTVSTVDNAPVITLVATPVISAGTNATYQNVPIAFVATATDPDGDTLTYTWTFGDGGKGDVTATQAASALNQTHTFAAANVYPVTFTADDGRGVAGVSVKSITLNLNILANGPPTVTMGWTDPVGNVSSLNTYANVPLTFTATDTDPNGDPVALSWNFGDGSALVTGQTTVVHSFAAVGATTVQVTATDGKGGVTTKSATLNVQQNHAPVAQVTTAVANLLQNKSYTFTASATDPDAGDTIALYNWNFGDGTPIVSSTTNTQPHTYASTYLGSASVSVSAMDNHGSTGNFSPAAVFTVVTTPLPTGAFVTPSGAATYNTELGAVGVAVTYVVSMTNPNGTGFLPLSSLTFYPGESAATLLSATANGNGTYTYQVRYAPAGTATSRTLTPTLVATDLQGITGLAQAGGPVTINTQAVNHPPQSTFTSTSTPSAGTNASWQGVAFTFAGTATDPDSDAMTYAIAFGDTGGAGNVATTPVPASGAISATHTYMTSGIYSAVLTVSDGRTNGTVTITLNMNIQANAAPTVTATVADTFGNPVTANTYANVPLTFTAVPADPNGDTVTLTWNFGDGTPTVTGTGLVQTHTFIATGSIPVVVTADDGKGNAGTTPTWAKTLNVQANHAPVAKVTTAAATLDMNKSYTFTASGTDADAGDTIDHYIWSFGDGSTTGLTSAGGATTSTTHVYAAAGTYAVSVSAMDNHGSTGNYSPAVNFTLATSTNPVVTFTSPAATLSLNAGTTVNQDILFTVTNPNASLGATSPLPTTGIAFSTNDSVGTTTLLGVTSMGGTSYKATVRYAAAASSGTRTATPSAAAQDSLGIPAAPMAVVGNPITLVTGSFGNPSIGVTNPATSSSTAYTLASLTLAFTLSNPTANPTTYKVDWGDATTPATTVLTDPTLATTGLTVSLSHAYQAAGSFLVTITAYDNRSDSTSTAVPQYRTFTISNNAYPRATITSPQASATLPASINGQNPSAPIINLAPGATDPAIVVIPLNGRLNFAGTSTGPSSGTYQSQWTFQGGVPNAFLGDTPGSVVFPGQAGQILAYLVTYTTMDQFGRSSSSAPGVTANTYEKWVVVDGVNTQNFNLSFMYRQKSDNNGTASLAVVQTPANGLGASVQIFQDGANNTYQVQDSQGVNATVSIPVRSNLSFQFLVPSTVATAAGDSINYMMQIPNAPNVDPALGTTLQSNISSFGFGNPAATAAPWWNPTLQIVTAQGFAAETLQARERKFQGTVYFKTIIPALPSLPYPDPLNMVLGGSPPLNDRWFDRLSVPLLSSDSLGAIQAEDATGIPYDWSGLRATQMFAEWPIYLMTLLPSVACPTEIPPDTATATAKSTDLGFVLDWPTFANYTNTPPTTTTFTASKMQAWRIPAATTDPYDLSLAGWDDSSVTVQLNPTEIGNTEQNSFANMLINTPGTASLSGGIQGLPIPYDFNDANWTPKGYAFESSNLLNLLQTVATFSYAEYLWSSVWARPLVLNRSSVLAADATVDASHNLTLIPEFRNSQPTLWPKHAGITPGNGAFDMTTSGVGTFNASSPGVDGGATPSSTGVGHFYWTAYTPFYTSATGSAIARTWLGLEAAPQLPRTDFSAIPDASTRGTDAVFDGSGNLLTAGVPGTIGNPVAKIGFVPPPEVIVDKRTVVNGVPQNGTVGGYRVRWFNATKDAHGNPVPPDFWVVEFTVGTNTYHYMLPSSYPADTQKITDPIVTDARLYLPSTCIPYDPSAGSPALTTQGPLATDLVAPGYCWFDVPAELRADIQQPSTTCAVTVFAIKAFPNNNAAIPPLPANPANQIPGVVYARALQRPDWIDAIKTATATIKVDAGRPAAAKSDMQYVYKVPFNYAWDIVIANSPCTLVAP